MREWESEESSDTCCKCGKEVFESCPECFVPSTTMNALAAAARGFDTTSWDEFKLAQEQQGQNQMDHDEEYTNGN